MDFKAKKTPSQIDVERHQVVIKGMKPQEDVMITAFWTLNTQPQGGGY